MDTDKYMIPEFIMKISNLLEMTTPSSDPTNMGGSQAPQFGRDPHVLEDETLEETTAGAIATGAPTDMGMQTRGKGSMFQGIKTSKKFVNSPVKEAAIDPEQEKIDSLRRSRQEKERGSERELGRDPKPSGQYYIMINGSMYKRDGEGVMFNSSAEAYRAVERIREFRKSKGWGTARYDVIQQKSMEEALDPKSISALNQAKQSIAKNREADLSAWEQDFRKNFASKYGSQPTMAAQRPLTVPTSKAAPAPKPLEKHSVLKSRLEKLKAVTERQKYLDYLTFKAEQKGLLNPRLEADIDTSLYVKGAEKDDYQALGQKIEKSIELMKNRLGINKLAYKKPTPMREQGVAEGTDPNTQSHADAFKSETDTMKPSTKKYVGRKGGKEVTARKDEQGNVKFYHRDGIKGPLKRVTEGTSTTWEVSYDYGPHMSKTVTVKASSEQEARAKVEKAAEKKGLDIMINSVESAEQGMAEGSDVMEAELSEEQLLASELKKRLDLFNKGKDKQLGSKPKDKGILTKEGQMTAESLPKEYIEKAIYRVLMRKYPEVINQYGAPIVGDAISSVADMHKDIENIEAEEASIMLHQVVNQLNRHLQMREAKQRLDPSCWKGYKKQGTKMKGGTRVNNCVPK